MNPVRENMKITLPSGYSEFEIGADHDIVLEFTAGQDAEVFLKITRAGKITMRTLTSGKAEVTYLVWNESETPVAFTEEHRVLGDSALHVAYGEIVRGDAEHNTVIDLLEPGARAHLSSATLASAHKHYKVVMTSRAPHTNGDMTNYAVILRDGEYVMDAAGAIEKGAHTSESHQTSRALCFDDTMAATIIPALLIDDNDVKASHAASVGRVDEEQLYYLMSRGLTLNDCMRLISTGYLMPIADTIHNDHLRETLRKELEEKIAAIC